MDPRRPDPHDEPTPAELTDVERALRALGGAPAPDDVVRRLDAALDERLPAHAPPVRRRRRLALRPVLAIGAPLAALVAAGILIVPHLGGGSPGSSGSAYSVPASASVSAGAASAESQVVPGPQRSIAGGAPTAPATADDGSGAGSARTTTSAASGGVAPKAATVQPAAAQVGAKVRAAAEAAYRAAELAIRRSDAPAP